jgi:glucose-1-phosphate thymidylyltransferase
MTCIILAAGYATRLYPLTENFPKPLLEVSGKTILDWLIEDIHSTKAVDNYVIASNGKYANHFTEWANQKPHPITIVNNLTTTNETRLGAVKDLELAINKTQTTDDLLVIAGDNLLDFSLSSLIEYANKKKTSCVMRYYEADSEKCKKSATIEFNTNERITLMLEKPTKPTSNWLVPPFYYITAKDAEKVPQAIKEGCVVDSPGAFIAWLCQQSPVHAMKMPGSRYDIGDLQSYEDVKIQ